MEWFNQLLDYKLIAMFPKTLAIMLGFYFFVKTADFITGLLKTWKGVIKYSSRIMRDGIIRWIGELVAISFVIALDLVLGMDFYLTYFTLALFIYKEGGSIVENLRVIEVDLPAQVAEKLESFTNTKKGDK